MGNVYKEGGMTFRMGTLAAQWQCSEGRVDYPFWPGLERENRFPIERYINWVVVGYFKKYGETYGLFYGEFDLPRINEFLGQK